MKKTNDEIEALKQNWMKDPCWDIEDTEGFEEHKEELLAWVKEYESVRQRDAEKFIARRARFVAIETGITDSYIQQNVHTFAEIEREVKKALDYDDCSANTLQAAQVHATLLLSAQIARIADVLESRSETEDANDNLEFMTKLYSTK